MRNIRVAVGLLAVGLFTPPLVAAQEIQTALSFIPAAVFDTADTGPGVGGAATFDLSSRLALEVTGSYIDRGSGSNALTLQGGVLANLVSGDRRLVPFVAAGGGMYRASFDLGAPRYFGSLGSFGPGLGVCDGTGVCPYGNMPAFYGRRLGPMVAPAAGGAWPTRTFTDPAFHLGAGARVNLNEHVFVRPEFRGLFVAADSNTHSLGVLSVALGYRF